MPPKPRKVRQSASVGQHPRIVELERSDISDYLGRAEVPDEPLIKQIERLQAEAAAKSSKSTSSATDKKSFNSSPASFNEADLTPSEQFMFGILDYIAYLIPLLSVHVALDIVVRVQYGQAYGVDWGISDVLLRTLVTIPVLILLHLFVKDYTKTRLFRISGFFASVAMGGYLLRVSYDEGYYATMKRAPPIGTIWVWLFIELDWEWAASSLVVIGFWMWLRGYRII